MGEALHTVWFDGRSPRPHEAWLRLEGADLVLRTDSGEHRYPAARVRWPERQVHGMRQVELPDGGLIQHADGAEWDAWATRALGHREGWVVRAMQSWRLTAAALVGTVVILAVTWTWGVPWVSRQLAQALPPALERQLGEQGLAQFERALLKPSTLPPARQEALTARWQEVVARAYPAGDAPEWRLHFRSSKVLGPNAFALPGGDLVVTDELVALLADQLDALFGVLAHELGHVEHRHGTDLLVRASLAGAVVGVVFGDMGGFLAAVPAALATQAYSRAAEREADEVSARMLHANRIDPAVMATFFERLAATEAGSAASGLPIAISSHPADDERARFFRGWRAANP